MLAPLRFAISLFGPRRSSKARLASVCGIVTGNRTKSSGKSSASISSISISSIGAGGETEEGLIEEDSRADTTLLGRGFRVITVHDYTCSVTGFSSDLGELEAVSVVDAVTVAEDTKGNAVLLRINQALHKPDEKRSLLSTYQVRHNGIRVDATPVQFDKTSAFGIVLPKEDAEDATIRFTLRGVSAGFKVRTPTNEELDTMQPYELTSQLYWDPQSESHAKEEVVAQRAVGYVSEYRQALSVQVDREESRRVNLSAIWTAPTDDLIYNERIIGAEDDVSISSSSSSSSDSNMSVDSNNDIVKSSSSLKRITAKIKSIDSSRLRRVKAVASKAATSGKRQPIVNAEKLAKMWGIGIERAKKTVQETTQQAVRDVTKPLTRRFRTRKALLRRRRFRGTTYSDTAFAKFKSARGNTCIQVFVTDFGLSVAYPMKAKEDAHKSLSLFFNEYGVPEHIHTDNATEMQAYRKGSRKWSQTCTDEGGIKCTTIEPYSPWQNRAEREIGQTKSLSLRQMKKYAVPMKLWDFSFEYHAAVRSRMHRDDIPSLEGGIPLERVESNTIDISEYAQFHFYEPIWYWDPANVSKYPDMGEKLGRFVGVAHSVGQAMCFYVVPLQSKSRFANFLYKARSTVRSILPEEKASDEFKSRLAELDKTIIAKCGDPVTQATLDAAFPEDSLPYEDEALISISPVEGEEQVPDIDDEGIVTPEETDEFMNAEVSLPRGDGYQRAVVSHRKRDRGGNLIGRRNNNPLLDTRVYEARFPDGEAIEVAANVVAESLFRVCDSDGNEFLLIKEILDHKSDETAVPESDGWIKRKENRPPERRKTTKGWHLLIEWADGHVSWARLADMKESYPEQVAEYAKGNKIIHEPAFAWWAPSLLKKRRVVIKKLKSRYWKRTHKYGIRIPKSPAEALRLDNENGNTLWADAMTRERTNTQCTFNVLDEGAPPPRGFQKITCHMIFDVKLDAGFTRKARYVADGHKAAAPDVMTYASVVSRDSVRIVLTLAALNGLDLQCGDVKNAYLNAKPKENCYFIAGVEFGTKKGRVVVIVRALYGLASSAAAWASALRALMRDLGFFPCKADGDVWMRLSLDTTKVVSFADSVEGETRRLGGTTPEGKPAGEQYYEYVLIHTDDILVASRRANQILDAIDSVFNLKADKKTGKKYGEPDIYLGSQIKKHRHQSDDPNGPFSWSMSGDHYVEKAIQDVEQVLMSHGRELRANQKSPFDTGYRPEMDVSPELDDENFSYFQELIGVLRWAVELGRADIALEVALLSRHLASPRRGHLDQCFNIFAYMKKQPKAKLVMNPERMHLDTDYASSFPSSKQQKDWEEFYGEVKDEVPPDAPAPQGKPVEINAWVDADHAGDRLTRRSHTGCIIFINSAPILWYTKRQATIESSTFGSEAVALRTLLGLVKDLRYKLRMLGVPLAGPAVVFGDNKSVVNGASIPEAKLSKKHLGICYHAVREASAAGVWKVGFTKGVDNIANCLTKILSGTQKEKEIGQWMYRNSE